MKTHLLVVGLLAVSLMTAFGQTRRPFVEKKVSAAGDVTYDTIWKVRVLETRIEEGARIQVETWVPEKKAIKFTPKELAAMTAKGNFLIGNEFLSSTGNTARLGYFVSDNLLFGLNGHYAGKATFVSAFLRPYFGSSTSGKFFLDFGLNVSAVADQSTVGYGVAGGYAFFLNRYVGFDISTGYQYMNNAGDMTLSLGYQIFLSR